MLTPDLQLALTLADRAGAAILPHFRRLAGIDNKHALPGGFDPVTIADRAAEEAIRDHLMEVAPADGVLGEEFPARQSGSGRTWIVDPIDGTRGFVMGLPTWGTLVALHDGSAVTAGVMAQPFVGDRFVADATGAWFMGRGEGPDEARPMSTRACPDLSDALIAATSPDMFSGPWGGAFARVREKARAVRYGADCYGYAMVAAGQCDAVVEMGLKPYDIAPFLPIIQAAGGLVTDFAGSPIEPMLLTGYAGEALAVGDPALLPQILDTLRG